MAHTTSSAGPGPSTKASAGYCSANKNVASIIVRRKPISGMTSRTSGHSAKRTRRMPAIDKKDHGGRDAGLRQEYAEEDAGDAPRELMQRGMRRQPVDMRIRQELHMRRRRICRVCRGRA